jgi:hypothetical protein
MRFTKHKLLFQNIFSTKLFALVLFGFIHFSFTPFSDIIESAAKTNYNGIWQGKAQVDFGEGFKDQFEYELLLTQTGKKITGYSTTILTIGSKKYVSKALLEGEVRGKTLICREVRNVYEDKLPVGWILISKMELMYKDIHNYQTLDGLYKCDDKTGGKLILEKKPPRV